MTVLAAVLGAIPMAVATSWYMMRQCRKPTGWLGRFIARTMNRSHAKLTSWGLEHVHVGRRDVVLDIGCGGGSTVRKLAAMADLGTVYGVDYAEASVAASRRFNRAAIESGRVAIQSGSVSHLPFLDGSFDLATAVETHYYWPDLACDVREIGRALKPGGTLLIVAESYRGRGLGFLHHLAMQPIGGVLLTPEEHRALLEHAGYADVRIDLDRARGWICATGRKTT